MNQITDVISRHGTATHVTCDLDTALAELTTNGSLDTVIVPTGAEAPVEWLASELGLPTSVVEQYARQVHREDHAVTLVALHGARRHESALRRAVLMPGRNAANGHPGEEAADEGEDRVFFQALCEATRQLGASKVAICSRTNCQVHSHRAMLAGKALAEFCDDAAMPVLRSCCFLGREFAGMNLQELCQRGSDGHVSAPVTLERETCPEATVVRMHW